MRGQRGCAANRRVSHARALRSWTAAAWLPSRPAPAHCKRASAPAFLLFERHGIELQPMLDQPIAELARDDAALLSHPHALGDALRFDIGGVRHDHLVVTAIS